MRLEVFASEADVASAAVDRLERSVPSQSSRDALAPVILPAGRTPLPLYAELLRRSTERRLDLARVRFFQLDEYVGCGPADARSFHRLLRSHLLDPLERAPEHDRLLDGTAKDSRAEIERHARNLAQEGGAALCFLGLGANGHVAFNEPGTRLDQGAHEVALAPETKAVAEREFGPGRAPQRGITLGLHEIHASKRIVLIVTGASKAAILRALRNDPPSSARPASLLLGHPDVEVLADRAAASER
jgi:glucosamine-6-phosphate deaminase